MLTRFAGAVLFAVLAPLGAGAAQWAVPAESGALSAALMAAKPGDTLLLLSGLHAGPVTIDKPVTLKGDGSAEIAGPGHGSVITVRAPDVTLRGLRITGSGSSNETLDAGVKLTTYMDFRSGLFLSLRDRPSVAHFRRT